MSESPFRLTLETRTTTSKEREEWYHAEKIRRKEEMDKSYKEFYALSLFDAPETRTYLIRIDENDPRYATAAYEEYYITSCFPMNKL